MERVGNTVMIPADEYDTLRSRVNEADRIILQLTKEHDSSPEYVKGFEMARDYFSRYTKDV